MTRVRERAPAPRRRSSRGAEIEADVAAIHQQARHARPSRGHLAWLDSGEAEAYELHGAVWVAPSRAPLQQGYRSGAHPLVAARRWQEELGHRVSGPPGTPAPPAPPERADPLSVVLRVVGEVAELPGRVGDRKVFVAAIWNRARDRLPFPDVEEFGRWLVRQHQASKLVLARADLVAAMPSDMVQRSEVRADGATFHFVLDPRVR